MIMHVSRATLLACSALLAIAVSGCDSQSVDTAAGNVPDESADFFDDHFTDRSEFAHYSAHDMDENRRDADNFDGELVLGAALPDSFRNWESPHVYPLDLTPNSDLLLAVNTPDAKLEVFQMNGGIPVSVNAIPVGLDPVTVRARSNNEAWVVNQISDTISIVDLNAGVVRHTLQTDDEPADVIFAGNPQRAFVSASQANTIMVFDPSNLSAEPQRISIAGEDPRALAISLDGDTVYAAIFESGNASTVVRGGRTRTEYLGVESPNGPYGGQNPPPNNGDEFMPALNPALPTPPEVSMIVKKDASERWMDDNNGDWTELVSGNRAAESGRTTGWDMPDNDVAIINANTLDVTYQSTLMNMVMGISVNPLNNRVTLVGTDANNEVRFEPNLKSHFVTSTYADFTAQGGNVRIEDLNDHLDPATTFLPAQERAQSIGDPRSITWEPSGTTGYVTGMGSNSVLQINNNGERGNNTAVQVGQGPTASIVHVPSGKLLVLNRFDASISVVNFSTVAEEQRIPFSFDPTPNFVNEGRRLLYDTQAFSGLGQVSCASCHVDARYDRLAWDLGNPAGEMEFVEDFPFHPMKGPMRTTSLVGVVGSPVLHFRGDKETLPDFSPTYTNLQGLLNEPTDEEMNQLELFIDTIQTPPNPFRDLDNTMPELLLIPGPDGRIGNPNNPSNDCSSCHNLDTNGRGDLQTGGNNSPGQQTTTAPSLRSMYEILGMSLSRTDSTAGFAFIADGANDTQAGNTLRNNNSLAFMMAYNGDLVNDTHAAVGKQVTLNGNQTAEDMEILTQLLELASDHLIGLVAHGLHGNNRDQRGFTYLPDTGLFQASTAVETTTLVNLQNLANIDSPMTFTAVPAGSEFRLGVDRNDDGTYDLDELDSPLTSTTDEEGNLLSNGTFNTDLSGWSACGGQATLANSTAQLSNGGCIYQEIAIIPQATYTLNCTATASTGYTSVQLGISDASFATIAAEFDVVNGATLELATASVVAPESSARGVVTLYADEQADFESCTLIVDQSSITPVTVQPVSNELLVNADFSANLNSWNSCGGQQSVSADGLNGGNAVTLSASGCLFQEFNLTPGAQYGLRCIGQSEQDFSSVSFTTYNSSFVEIDSQQVVVSNTGAYQNNGISIAANDNARIGAITLYTDSGAKFDSCGVVVTGGVTPAPFVPVNDADNLIKNGDFTNDNTDWLSCGGTQSIVATDQNNNKAMALGAGGCVYQEFSITPGKSYELSCRGSAVEFSSLSISYSDLNFVSLGGDNTPVAGATLSPVSTSAISPLNAARGSVTLYADESAVFDDCAVVER